VRSLSAGSNESGGHFLNGGCNCSATLSRKIVFCTGKSSDALYVLSWWIVTRGIRFSAEDMEGMEELRVNNFVKIVNGD